MNSFLTPHRLLSGLAAVLVLAFAGTAVADELPDPRGKWAHGNDVLEFTGKNVKRGRYTVEVDYMGMRVSSRGRWMQTEPGLLVWKLTDINIGGAPGDSMMLPKAGDFMYGLFKRNAPDKLKLFYVMKGFSTKQKSDQPPPADLAGGTDYLNKAPAK